MKKMLFSLFAAVMAVSFIACANSSDGGSSDPEKKGNKDPEVKKTYTVTYDDGVADEDINIPFDDNDYAEGETVTVKFNIGDREDYIFKGWTDGTTLYTENGTKTFKMPAKNVTLIAQWTPNSSNPTYTVTYDDGVADETIAVPTDYTDYEEGDTVTVLFDGIGTRENYTFNGWSDGSNTYTKDGTKTFTMPAKNVTLTAQWKKNASIPEDDYNFAGSNWSADGAYISNSVSRAQNGARIKVTVYTLEFSKKDNTVKSTRGWCAEGTYTSQGKTAYVTLVKENENIEFELTVDDTEEPNTATDSKLNLTWTRGEDNYDIEGTTWSGGNLTITFSADDNTFTGKRGDTDISGTYEINTTNTPHTIVKGNETLVKQE